MQSPLFISNCSNYFFSNPLKGQVTPQYHNGIQIFTIACSASCGSPERNIELFHSFSKCGRIDIKYLCCPFFTFHSAVAGIKNLSDVVGHYRI